MEWILEAVEIAAIAWLAWEAKFRKARETYQVFERKRHVVGPALKGGIET